MKFFEWIFGIVGVVTFIALGLMILVFTPQNWLSRFFHQRTTLHSTISSDGIFIAILENAGTDEQKLLVRELKPKGKWRAIQAPELIQTIHFGLNPNELLVTHVSNKENRTDRLSKIDLSRPDSQLTTLYEASDLAFPIEVKPGTVLVRIGIPNQKYRVYWALVGADKQAIKVGPDESLPFSAPSIVDGGFFWLEDRIGKDEGLHPLIHAYAFPWGKAPHIDSLTLDKSTTNLKCDYSGKRCLRTYIANLNVGTKFIYKIESIWQGQRCDVSNINGSIGSVGITPDGLMAVVSIASAFDQPEYPMTIQFSNTQCEPVAVKHFSFKEE
jgi:hypothetical protein